MSLRVRLINLAVVAMLTGYAAPTFAVAIYSGDLELKLLMPGAKTNLFGFGGLTAQFVDETVIIPTATASASRGDSTWFYVDIVPPPPDGQDQRVGRSIKNVAVDGSAGPGYGYSYAESQGVLFARLGNLSGRGEPFPPSQIFNAVFNLSFGYDLLAHIDDPALEFAEAQVGISVRAKPEVGGAWTTYFSIIDDIVANDAVATVVDAEFTIPLLPNSITLFETQFYVNGKALSVSAPPLPPIDPLEPPPFPEPASSLLLGIGIYLTHVFRRRAG